MYLGYSCGIEFKSCVSTIMVPAAVSVLSLVLLPIKNKPNSIYTKNLKSNNDLL